MRSRVESEVVSLEALSVLLQHTAFVADQRNICRVLLVCRAWRTAVQQSRSYLTDLTFTLETSDAPGGCSRNSIAKFIQFAHWVSRYPHVIRSIEIDVSEDAALDASFSSAMQSILAMAFRAADAADSVTAAGTAAGTAALKLQAFKCCSASSLLLSALPAATLTELFITIPETWDAQQALGRLSNLQHLQLGKEGPGLSAEYLSSISKLTKLTRLSLDPLHSTRELLLLPQQLSNLSVTFLEDIGPIALDLADLTQLQQLEVSAYDPVTACDLPLQLRQLTIRCDGPAVPALTVTSLSQLRQLSIIRSEDSVQQLLALKQSHKLQKLALSYRGIEHAYAAAPAWPQLQQLVSLQLELRCNVDQISQMASIMDTLSGMKGLTTLSICGAGVVDAEDDDNFIDEELVAQLATARQLTTISQCIGHLTKLKELELDFTNWPPMKQGDLAHLTNLTRLTSLQLNFGPDLHEDPRDIRALSTLTRLKSLSLHCFEQLSILPVFGKLQRLTHLQLYGLSQQLQMIGLKYLTVLRNLRYLDGFEQCGQSAMNKFWSNLRA